MSRSFNLPKLSLEELKNLLSNAQRLGRDDVATDVLKELSRRGAARTADYATLKWNQQTATEALQPFVQISLTVPGNRRTTYTQAGGRKIGRAKDHPEWMWVDTYTAIKTPKVNAVFICYIPQPGEEAVFELRISGKTAARYSPDELVEALARWAEIASEAL